MSTGPHPAGVTSTAPVRKARRLVQVGGFLRKETASVARQPRLLLVLVSGPFLILLLFAVGYNDQQAVLRTAFVGPEDSVYEQSIDQFAEGLQKYVRNAGYSNDLVAAESRLRDGDIDAIVVFPADPLDSVLSGEQAQITVLHDKIDPIQQVAVEVSSQVAVMELNARVLEEIVGRAQETLVPVNDSLATANSVADELLAAVERGDDQAASDALGDLDSATTSIETVGSASSELARALGADEATLDALAEFRVSAADLRSTIDLAASGDRVSVENATTVREQLDQVTETAASAATIDPNVVVRPFTADTASLQREPIAVADYFAPAAIALLLQHMVLTFAAMSLVSDRTLGMFEVFRVGPVNAPRIMAGKYLSFMLVGGAVAAALVGLMVFALDLPIRGDVTWVAIGLGGLLAASIGLGLTLALLARSDVQAVQFAMLALLAGLFFGGFFLDLDAFSYPVKLLSWIMPVTYATRLLRDVLLRGVEPSEFDLFGLAASDGRIRVRCVVAPVPSVESAMNDRSETIPRNRAFARMSTLWRSPHDQRRAGQLMIALGVVGALVAVFGTIGGWIFVGQVANASDDSLDVTVQALNAVDDTIDLAEEVLTSTVDAVDALAGTLEAVSGSFETGTAAIDEVASLADTLGPSLADAGDTVRTLETVGDQIDGVLGALSRVPLGPDYNPDNGLGDTFGRLADTLEGLPAQLESTSGSLTDFTENAGSLQAELDRFATSVGSIATDLADTSDLVDQYRTSVEDARQLAVGTKNDLDNSVTMMRLLLVVGGITLLLGQIVPLWLGRSLLDDLPDELPDDV